MNYPAAELTGYHPYLILKRNAASCGELTQKEIKNSKLPFYICACKILLSCLKHDILIKLMHSTGLT